MTDTLATPDDAPEPDADGTPEGEPAAELEANEPADQSAAESDRLIGQAEYTRSQQAFSALKTELGLPRTATREDVLAHVRQLSQPADDGDDETEPEPEADPRIAEAEQRAFLAEIRVARAVYGADFTDAALETINTLRTTDDPEELLTALAAFRDRFAVAAAPADGDDEPGDDGDPRVPLPVGSSEGDAGPSARQRQPASTGGRRESGAVSAVRGIFNDLGIGSRDPS